MKPKSFNRFIQLNQLVAPPPQLLIPNPNLNSHSSLLTNPTNMPKEITTSPENKNSTLRNTIRALVVAGLIAIPTKKANAADCVPANWIGAPGCTEACPDVDKWQIQDITGGSIELYFPNDTKGRYLFYKSVNGDNYPFNPGELKWSSKAIEGHNFVKGISKHRADGTIDTIFKHSSAADINTGKIKNFSEAQGLPSGIEKQHFDCNAGGTDPEPGGGGGGCFADTVAGSLSDADVPGQIMLKEATEAVKSFAAEIKGKIAGLFHGKESAPAR